MQATTTLPYSRKSEIQQEALTRAITGQSLSNYPAIFQGLLAKGIAEDQIKPRENVFSYQAWKALGRHVKRGEHGIKVATVRDFRKTVIDRDTGEKKEEVYSVPWTATVFHISQTEPDTPRGIVNPACSSNPLTA
jgi:antirestriction protein ArdC